MTSGGVGSFIELMNCVSEYGRENVISLFSDTKMEDEDLYRFLDDCIKHAGCKFVKLEDGRDVWQVFQDVKFIGNSRIDPCSRVLKRDLLNKWVRDNYKANECVIHFGIDYSEKHRLERVQKLQAPYECRSILVEKQVMMTVEEKFKYCRDFGIEPPRLYAMGFSHNNCGGFCVKAGLAQFKLLLEKMPDRYEWHVQREKETKEKNPKAKPFLRKIENGQYKYMWLDEYREFLKSNGLTGEQQFDFGGCGCALE